MTAAVKLNRDRKFKIVSDDFYTVYICEVNLFSLLIGIDDTVLIQIQIYGKRSRAFYNDSRHFTVRLWSSLDRVESCAFEADLQFAGDILSL